MATKSTIGLCAEGGSSFDKRSLRAYAFILRINSLVVAKERFEPFAALRVNSHRVWARWESNPHDLAIIAF